MKADLVALRYFLLLRWQYFVGLLVVGLAYGVFETFSIGLLLPVLSVIIVPEQLESYGPLASWLARVALIVPGVAPIVSGLLMLVAMILAKNVLGVARDIMAEFLGLRVREDTQKELFASILGAPMSFLDRYKKGDLQYRVITAPNQMGNLVSLVPTMLTEGTKVLLIMALLVSISLPATAVVAVLGGVFLVLVLRVSARISSITGRERAAASAAQTVLCQQALQGLRTLKAYKAEGFWQGLFDHQTHRFYSFARRDVAYASLPSRLLETVAFVALALIVGVYSLGSGTAGISEALPIVGTFAFALQRALPALSVLGRSQMSLMALLPFGTATLKALEDAHGVRTVGGGEEVRLTGSVNFESVTFRYEQRPDHPALDDVSLTVPRKRFTAIVGESGSGKTTILSLLLGFAKPSEGRVTVDGTDMEQVDHAKWLDQVGYVAQDPFLFHGTIRENLEFGHGPWAEDALWRALEEANVADFVRQLPEGLETIVGDDGGRLSGGQRQRLCIARALLRNPSIMVFDEATSALDLRAERAVAETIEALARQRTVVFVTHRYSTIRGADFVYVMDAGRVVEAGAIQDLVARDGGAFRSLLMARDPSGTGERSSLLPSASGT